MKLGVVMDPIGSINIKKDSTFEMLWQAQQLGWQLSYFEMGDLSIKNGVALGSERILNVHQDADHWFDLEPAGEVELGSLDAI